MDSDDLKGLAGRTMVIGTATNLIIGLYNALKGFDNLMEIVMPVAIIQLAISTTSLIIFDQAVEAEKESRKKQRLDELEDRIKILETRVFTGD